MHHPPLLLFWALSGIVASAMPVSEPIHTSVVATHNPSRQQALKFETLSPELLPADEVASLYQDSDGFIWIATRNGLARYDGYRAKLYTLESGRGAYSERMLRRMAEEKDGRGLIIGTDRGLLMLDRSTGQMTQMQDPAIDNLNVNDILVDENGRIWVCGDKGLFFKDSERLGFTRIDLRTGFNDSGLTDLIDILLDDNGNLWISSWHKGLHRYNPTTGQLFAYKEGELIDSYVLHQDNEGNLWVGTWGSGLLRIDSSELYSERPSYTRYRHGRNPNSILDDIIYDIDEDADGHIVVGSRSGFSTLSGKDKWTNYYPSEGTDALPFNDVNAILRTSDGTMYLGLFGGGVCKVLRDAPQSGVMTLSSVRERYKTNSVKSIYSTAPGRYLLGIAAHGFIFYDEENDSFTSYNDMPSFKGILYMSEVEDIIARDSSKREILLASYERGLYLYDRQTESIRNFNSANSALSNDCIRSLASDSEGNVWIGTRRGSYVLRADNSIITAGDFLGISELRDDCPIDDIAVDSNSDIWLATSYGGIIKADRKARKAVSYTIKDKPEVNSFSCVTADSEGRIWAGSTWNGLYVHDGKEDGFRKIEELAFIEGKGIRNVEQSPDGRIWVTTSTRAVSFSYENAMIDNVRYLQLGSERGYSPYFNNNSAMLIPEKEQIAFGTSHGIVLYSTRQDSLQNEASTLVLTSMTAGGSPVEGIEKRSSVSLSSKQSDFDITFSLMDYSGRDGDVYKYRLRRKHSAKSAPNWTIIGGNDNMASFRDIRPGRYVFEIYAAKPGALMKSNYSSLDIEVRQNPWISWWAILIYSLLGMSVIVLVAMEIRSRLRFKRKAEFEQINAQKSEEVNQAKLRFFTDISHEFLTPLSIITASIESLEPRREEDKSILNVMSTNAIRLTRLVQQVIDFRKVESDKLSLKVSQADAADFIGRCVEAFQPLVRKRNLYISYEVEPRKIKAWFDPDKLDKILYNLISNAVKYTPEGDSVRIVADGTSEGKLVIKCINEGNLIDGKTRSRLFKRFYEGDYRKFGTVGNGIGLSLVKSLVEAHKGQIEVQSSPEVGNCFIVTLPISREAYTEAEIDNSPVPDSPLGYTLGENIIKDEHHTVLLVDDNEEVLSSFSAILSKRFSMLTCSSAEEALKLLDSHSIDVVVSDVMMPGMNGLELCHRIKESVETSHIPVILLTGRSTEQASTEAYDCGADGFVTKPCNFSVLAAMIRNLIRKQERKSADFRKQLVFEVSDIDYTSMDKQFLQKAIDVVNAHISDSEFNQTDFVEEMNVSRTVLTEKLKSLTGFTPVAFIVNSRLTLAYKLIMEESDKIRVSDLAYSVGFNDPKYFSKKFRAKYGKSPKEISDEKKQQAK